jgi:hypothetical protein
MNLSRGPTTHAAQQHACCTWHTYAPLASWIARAAVLGYRMLLQGIISGCRETTWVTTIAGRRRHLPNIRAFGKNNNAERSQVRSSSLVHRWQLRKVCCIGCAAHPTRWHVPSPRLGCAQVVLAGLCWMAPLGCFCCPAVPCWPNVLAFVWTGCLRRAVCAELLSRNVCRLSARQ